MLLQYREPRNQFGSFRRKPKVDSSEKSEQQALVVALGGRLVHPTQSTKTLLDYTAPREFFLNPDEAAMVQLKPMGYLAAVDSAFILPELTDPIRQRPFSGF